MAFMNGVAATDQMLTSGDTIFLIGQRLNWIGSLAWAGFVIALLNRKKFTMQLGLSAALVTLIAGIPLGILTTMESARFSMFFMAPILSLLLIIIFFSPKGYQIISAWVVEQSKLSKDISVK